MRTLQRLARRPYLRLAVLSSFGALAAYLAASYIPYADPIVAALTALIAVRPTFHETASEALRQLLGTLIGAAAGFAVVSLVGFSPIAMFFLVGFAFIIARVFKLGEGGAAVIGLTIILVMGPLDDIALIEKRFGGVVLGTLIALITSLWVRPGKPHHRALTESLTNNDHSAEILVEISDYLSTHNGIVEREQAKEWTRRAEANMIAIGETRRDAESAVEASKWSPLIDKEDALAVLKQIQLASVTARTVYNMCNSLKIATNEGDQLLSSEVAANMAEVLAATATVISEQSEASQTMPSETLSAATTPVQEFQATRRAAIEDLRELDDTQPLLLAGSLLRDAENISQTLSDTIATEPKDQ